MIFIKDRLRNAALVYNWNICFVCNVIKEFFNLFNQQDKVIEQSSNKWEVINIEYNSLADIILPIICGSILWK